MVLLVVGGGSTAALDVDHDGPGPLPWRVGGRLGFTVDAAAFPDSSGDVLEAYVRLAPATLASLARQGAEARLRMTVRLRNRYGALHHEASQEFSVAASDTGGGFGKVVLLRLPVQSGSYRMSVKLEDLLSRKRGLAYAGRHVIRSASVEGEVEVPQPQDGRRLSEIEFVWGEAAPRTSAAFRHGESSSSLLPNPERLYGLMANELRAQFAATSSTAEPRPWHWRAKVLDHDGREVAVRESTVAAGPRLTQLVGMDISTEPAGGYELELSAWQEGDARPLVRRARFSIAWRSDTWQRSPRDIEDEVHFLLGGDDEEAFARMAPGEQERYLEEFWHERDPSPGTAENETRREYLRRVEYANRTWNRSSIDRGMFTDMGRVYIRRGEPDEILRQVIPAGDQTLDHLLQELDLSEDRPTGEVRTKGLGGDVRPFEVWVYDGARATPITAKPGASANQRTVKRVLYLFVDEQGYGDYRLRYSTE